MDVSSFTRTVTIAAFLTCAPSSARATPAQNFVESIGVNVHIMYRDGGYARLDRVREALDFLGVHHLRDQMPIPDAMRFGTLADAGFRFDFVVSGSPTGTTGQLQDIIAQLSAFEAKHAGAIEAIEGPNEVNNWPIAFDGVGGSQGAVNFQAALYEGVKSNERLKGIPVYNFTDYPQPPGKADYVTLHPYPKWGGQPWGYLKNDLARDTAFMPGTPRVVTEAGYASLASAVAWKGPREWSPVDEHRQAILTLNLLFGAFALGAPRTYLYQLLDAYPDPKNAEADKHLGLFDLGYQPKPAATAIRNLILLLKDTGRSVVPRNPVYRIKNMPESGHAMTLEKADGTDIVVLWNEALIWDGKTATPVAVPQTRVVLELGKQRRDLALYDPLEGVSPIRRISHTTRAELALSDRPILVAIAPAQN